MDHINLLGSEDVLRAGHTISAAADQMSRAAGIIDESNDRFLRRYEELVCRMERAVEKAHEESKRSIFERVFGK